MDAIRTLGYLILYGAYCTVAFIIAKAASEAGAHPLVTIAVGLGTVVVLSHLWESGGR